MMEKDSTKLINTVPQEVWDHIAELSTLNDVLALRATCKKASKVCRTYSRLYLHPTRISDVINICTAKSVFLTSLRQGIVEIVLLGTSNSPAFEWDSQGNLPHLMQYRPWPHSDRGLPRSPITTMDELRTIETWSWELSYSSLLKALENLPRLSRIVHATKADEEGYCAVPQSKMESHAANSAKHVDDPVCNRLYTHWSDVEVLCGILTFSNRGFTTLKCGQLSERAYDLRWESLGSDREMFMDHFGMESTRRTARTRGLTSRAMGLIQHITLPAAALHKHHWRELLALATSLRSLTIGMDWAEGVPAEPEPGARVDRDLASFQDYIDSQSFGDTPGLAQLEELNITDHRVGPTCLEPGYILHFLRPHKTSLQVVRFQNVIFCSISSPHRSVERDMRFMIRKLHSYGLRTAEVRVPRWHLRGADRNSGSFGEYEAGEAYQRDHLNLCAPDMFDELAEKLGVVERDGWWDFAEAVLPLEDDD